MNRNITAGHMVDRTVKPTARQPGQPTGNKSVVPTSLQTATNNTAEQYGTKDVQSDNSRQAANFKRLSSLPYTKMSDLEKRSQQEFLKRNSSGF
ncbi:hypothetical protein [Pseudomonas kilonensis]|uniref:hypothetical protein n=1 Tax=Pseudomonas kilonensis TaxID=132476 RepID=UPI00046368E7|nr:hypothetical protein [Pseudomonas kilonensis]